MRFRAVVEYDGLDFEGWQRQPGRRTVQGVIEAGLASVSARPVAVVGAGRTDRGVHATGQVAHFDMEWMREADVLQRAMNAVLPRDVALDALQPASDAFHARFSAVGRSYVYRLWRGEVRSPLRRRVTLHVPQPMSLAAMRAAAERFVGEHDFAAFGVPVIPGGTTTRRIDSCEIRANVLDEWQVHVDGNAFLRHQVRRMVGVLIDVGRGRYPPEAVTDALAGDRTAVKPRRVPAQGLTLTAVRYPPDGEIEPSARLRCQQGADEDEDLDA